MQPADYIDFATAAAAMQVTAIEMESQLGPVGV